MDVIVGVLALIVGVVLCLSGLGWFFVLLPIWGFVAGVIVGAAAVTAIAGDGFLATSLGLVVGLVVGVVFAAISYLYWYFAVLLSAGLTGAAVGATVLAAAGVTSSWLLFFFGALVGVLFVAGALVINYPIYLVIVNTALAGAGIAIAGLLLVLNRVDRGELGTGAVWERIGDNWFLGVIWLVAAGIGIVAQIRMIDRTPLPAGKWTRAQPGVTPLAA
jgi:hypothetical protein